MTAACSPSHPQARSLVSFGLSLLTSTVCLADALRPMCPSLPLFYAQSSTAFSQWCSHRNLRSDTSLLSSVTMYDTCGTAFSLLCNTLFSHVFSPAIQAHVPHKSMQELLQKMAGKLRHDDLVPMSNVTCNLTWLGTFLTSVKLQEHTIYTIQQIQFRLANLLAEIYESRVSERPIA